MLVKSVGSEPDFFQDRSEDGQADMEKSGDC